MNTIEKEVRAFAHRARKWLDPDSVKTVIDAGSLDGLSAIALADCFPDATVYAFECNPPSIERCRANLRDETRVRLVEKAVADIDGVAVFHAIDPVLTLTDHPDGNIGASSLFKASGLYPVEKYVQNPIEVPVCRIDSWALGEGVDAVDVLWMDLQGAELPALKGMGGLLRTVQVVYTEVEFKPIYEGQPLFPDVDEFLGANGFGMVERFYCDDWFGNVMYARKRSGGMLRGLLPGLFKRSRR